MNNGELSREELEKIRAGIDYASKEELEQLKNQIGSFSTGKDTPEEDIDLENVRGGQPLSYEEAKDDFEQKFGSSGR